MRGERRAELGQRAVALIRSNKGATDRTLALLRPLLDRALGARALPKRKPESGKTEHQDDVDASEAREESTTERFVDVALKLPLRTEFTYRLPTGMQAEVGHRVRVPFRGRHRP